MGLPDLSIRRPVLAIVMSTVIVVFGLIAVGERGSMLDPGPSFYMSKIAVGPEAVGAIDITASPTQNLRWIAKSKGEDVRDLTCIILDRPRHEDGVPGGAEAGDCAEPAIGGGDARIQLDGAIQALVGADTSVEAGIILEQDCGRDRRTKRCVGLTVEEALPRVDKLLDDASLSERREIRVIHGFGAGRLRKAVAGLLDGHPHVATWRPGHPHEGGGGATIVEIKD